MFLDDLTRLLDILDDEGRTLISRALCGDPTPERHDIRFRRADGSIVIGEAQSTLVFGGRQGVTRDVTKLRSQQSNLAALATRDRLTGLANRRLLDELFEASLSPTHRSG